MISDERRREYERNRYHTESAEQREVRRVKDKAYRDGVRQSVLERLGNKCTRCGFSDSRALQIDHINGNGKKDLKERKSQFSYIKSLADMPDAELYSRYQLLCANCNWIKRAENEEWK